MFSWKEEDDNLRRLLELVPIGFRAQLIHARANLGRMPTEVLEALHIIRSLMSLQIGRKHGLGIDDDLPAPRQPNDHIGSQSSFVGRYGLLFKKIAMDDHAGKFRHALQGNLAPAASNIRRAEGLDEIARFLL